MSPGAVLRQRRVELGLSVHDVAEATRVPPAHLQALEEDDLEALPAGPYAAAYHRTVRAFLDLEPTVGEISWRSATDPSTSSPAAPAGGPRRSGPPLAVLRVFALISTAALAMLSISALLPVLRSATPDPTGGGAAQRLIVRAVRNTPVRVWVDGELRQDGELAGGSERPFDGHRIEVEVDAVEDVKLTWNGEWLRPQGQQKAPRRLVFVDDEHGEVP